MERSIEQVKRKLWQFGFSVKEVKNIPGVAYDLLVEAKYPVKVIEGGLPSAEETQKGGLVLALVDGDKISYHICKRGKCWEESSPLKAFPKD